MSAYRLVLTFLLMLSSAVFRLSAQPTEAERKLFQDIKAKAGKGDALAQVALGNVYDFGLVGVTRNGGDAVKWYRKSAEQGNGEAQFCLGCCYSAGSGIQQDRSEAVKWWHKAADQGHAKAQYNLGFCYFQGQGVPKDTGEAVKWFRKAADQGLASGQFFLGASFYGGEGVPQDYAEAVKWFRKAADQEHADAQFVLARCYESGAGVPRNQGEAVNWFRKAAEQGIAGAQYRLGLAYARGQGVTQNQAEAVKWYRKAAEQNLADAQFILGGCYAFGDGVAKDYVEGYKWSLLAAAQGDVAAKNSITSLEGRMTREQIAEGQMLARGFKPRQVPSAGSDGSGKALAQTRPEASGTGFFITEDGFLMTNEHVVRDAAQIRLVTSAGLISAKVLKVDVANDLALLKAEGKFAALPVVASRSARLGATVATVGFPNIGLQGFAPKLAKGEIASLSGASDDPRYFQISVPVQPGNSGGALVDERGNVVGVVSAKLSAAVALSTSGALPENVNYAVKSSFLLSFLESVPEVSAKLKEPNTKERKFEDVVKSAEQAAVLVLVY